MPVQPCTDVVEHLQLCHRQTHVVLGDGAYGVSDLSRRARAALVTSLAVEEETAPGLEICLGCQHCQAVDRLDGHAGQGQRTGELPDLVSLGADAARPERSDRCAA